MRFLLVLALFGSTRTFCQKIERSLAGFAIGQDKAITRMVLGKPYLEDTTITGNSMQAFKHPMGEGWVMVFEFDKLNPNQIHTIQLSSLQQEMDAGMYGLSFGMQKAAIKKLLGNPNDVLSIGEYGEKWVYEKLSISIDINTKGKLWAIKLFEPNSEKLQQVELLIPSLKLFNKALQESNYRLAAEYVSPSLKIKQGKQMMGFSHAWNLELESDASGVFKQLSETLNRINLNDSINPKLYKQNIIPVKNAPNQFKTSYKVNNTWVDFFWRYEFGSYRIFDVIL